MAGVVAWALDVKFSPAIPEEHHHSCRQELKEPLPSLLPGVHSEQIVGIENLQEKIIF